MDRQSFETTGLNYDATVRNLELIGEAATHIPAEVREANPVVFSRQIIATRNTVTWESITILCGVLFRMIFPA
ncbi:DUF86 domain-containing protein [Methylotuvimicrobium sp. KM1]|uniref:HepT-like ribonuclease domain-containing protein n=1 Tax=Methylotuvimicrobium sp. KM1 TaxID=3377707 RepID=UPI00384B253C